MKIQKSNIVMSSKREYESHTSSISASLVTTADKAASLEFSEESKSLMEQMEEHRAMLAEEEKAAKEAKDSNIRNMFEEMLERNRRIQEQNENNRVESKDEFYIELLKKILAGLRGIKDGKYDPEAHRVNTAKAAYVEQKAMYGYSENQISINKQGRGGLVNLPSGGQGTKWTKTVVTSIFHGESEKTAFQSAGMVVTADGREIDFNVTIEMSRSFCESYETLSQSSYILTDPLVINLDTNIGTVTEQKFLFDIDSDGDNESISFAGKGSGFLAIDKNEDGEINNGKELFGTESGDGFKDLAEYDIDNNGWIDEADSVFNKLKVWIKDEDGNDRLLNLKEAGVGAIYLDSAATQFSLKEPEDNRTDAVIQRTGIYLKESGEVSTIQHIDLAI